MARFAAGCCWGLIAAAFVATASAQEAYPSRPIRLVVGFGAGGPTDIPARFVADKLGDALGQRVIVENKPAAAGMIATRDVLAQPRDGYTLLLLHAFRIDQHRSLQERRLQAQRARADLAGRQVLLRPGTCERHSGHRLRHRSCNTPRRIRAR